MKLSREQNRNRIIRDIAKRIKKNSVAVPLFKIENKPIGIHDIKKILKTRKRLCDELRELGKTI